MNAAERVEKVILRMERAVVAAKDGGKSRGEGQGDPAPVPR